MPGALFELYRSKVFELAKTIVIKFDPAAQSMNRELAGMGITVSDDPTTWKYYLNLAGEYYPQTDVMMQVESLDQLGNTIDFTKTNLASNRLTASEYRFGTRFYNRLLSQYPEQELLIRGILNPVDIDVAIQAENGTILYYDASLVEENEINLIPELEKWIKTTMARWHIADYTLVDDLYSASFMGMLYMNLPQVIMNIRLANCKTERAHSYHIREYLESHGKLSKYIKYLTKKQALWLYRNIRYIHRNAGTKQTFLMLVEHLLSERNLPLAEYDVRHNLSTLLQDLQPTTVMRRRAINFSHIGRGSDVREPGYVLGKEAEVVYMDAEEISRQENDLENKLKRYFGNTVPSKVLESSVVDTTDSVPFPLVDVLFNHWIYYAHIGTYQSSVKVLNPATGENFFLSAKDAVVLWMYCWLNGYLDDTNAAFFTDVPTITVRDIRRDVGPAESDLLNVIDSALVPQSTVDAALAIEHDVTLLTTPDAFYEACVDIQSGMNAHRELYVKTEHQVARGMVHGMVSQFYESVELEFEPAATSFVDWLDNKGIDLSAVQKDGFRTMTVTIVQDVTGAGINTSKELRAMHKAMLELMSKLSSYTVQYLATINSGSSLIVDRPSIRAGDFSGQATAEQYIHTPLLELIEVKGTYKTVDDADIQGENFVELPNMRASDNVDLSDVIEMRLDVSSNYKHSILTPIPIAGMLIQVTESVDLDDAIFNSDVPDYIYPDGSFYSDGN